MDAAEAEAESKEDGEEVERALSEDGKVWMLSVRDIDLLSIGCGVLGTGGGGTTHPFDVLYKQYVAAGSKIRIVKPDQLAADRNVIFCGFMGAQVRNSLVLLRSQTCVLQADGGNELLVAVQQMERHLAEHSNRVAHRVRL